MNNTTVVTIKNVSLFQPKQQQRQQQQQQKKVHFEGEKMCFCIRCRLFLAFYAKLAIYTRKATRPKIFLKFFFLFFFLLLFTKGEKCDNGVIFSKTICCRIGLLINHEWSCVISRRSRCVSHTVVINNIGPSLNPPPPFCFSLPPPFPTSQLQPQLNTSAFTSNVIYNPVASAYEF